jgi:hypothetical protein
MIQLHLTCVFAGLEAVSAVLSSRAPEPSVYGKKEMEFFFPQAKLFFRVLCYTRFGPIPGFQMGPVEFACMPREPMCSQLTMATEYIGIAEMERRYYCTSAVKTTLVPPVALFPLPATAKISSRRPHSPQAENPRSCTWRTVSALSPMTSCSGSWCSSL